MTELKRRQFLQTVGGAFIATAATGCGPEGRPAAASPQVPTLPVVPDASTRFMEMMGLKYPILQGPAGGVDLAVAVSEAGGLGGLWADSKADVVGLRARTKRALWINFAIVKEQERALKPLPAVLEGVAEAGGPVVIHFSWGLPRKENVAAIRAAKARFAVTVASREGARAAVDVGADYLHCQGLEAGGHLQANRPLDEALRQVVEEAKQVPVIAAGGIGDGLGIRRALLAGAAGAQLGTRFLATRECEYRQEYKDMLLKAKSSDTVATVCFSGNDDDTRRKPPFSGRRWR